MREHADQELGVMEQLAELDFGSSLGKFVEVGVGRWLWHADLDSG
jgi:hypothetical protein